MPLIYNSMNTCTHERTHSDGVTQHVPWQPCSISLFPCCKMLQNIPISGPGNTHSRQLLQSYRAVLLVTWPVCPQWLGGVGVKSGLASPAPGVSHLWGRAPVPGGGAGQARCTGRLLGVRGPCCQCSLLVWPSVVSSVPCRLQGGSPAATSLAAQFLPSEMGLRSPPPPPCGRQQQQTRITASTGEAAQRAMSAGARSSTAVAARRGGGQSAAWDPAGAAAGSSTASAAANSSQHGEQRQHEEASTAAAGAAGGSRRQSALQHQGQPASTAAPS